MAYCIILILNCLRETIQCLHVNHVPLFPLELHSRVDDMLLLTIVISISVIVMPRIKENQHGDANDEQKHPADDDSSLDQTNDVPLAAVRLVKLKLAEHPDGPQDAEENLNNEDKNSDVEKLQGKNVTRRSYFL